jgi:hypothetical protein
MMTMLSTVAFLLVGSNNLIRNPDFELVDAKSKGPEGFVLAGSATRDYVGYTDENASYGVHLTAAKGNAGSVSQLIAGIDQKQGKWIKLTFRGRPEDGFLVDDDKLFIKMEFFGKAGKTPMDSAERLIYREVLKDRADFAINGNNLLNGASVWRTYEFEELLPFAEVDSVRVTVGFAKGAAKAEKFTSFFVDDFELVQNDSSTDGRVEPGFKPSEPAVKGREVKLGGYWSYLATSNEKIAFPLVIKQANSKQLLYRGSSIFAGTMSSVMKEGFMSYEGQIATKSTPLPDNLVITFTGNGTIQVDSKNIPNHPTARFPDNYGTQGYNPGYIGEQRMRIVFPVEPKKSDLAIAMTEGNANRALNMGPTGFAVNGVVFYNPYDAGRSDASRIMDRCCGHPSPNYMYHYHKYPICVNTPFADKGQGHSPVIGFGKDGFPVYGPYEINGVMAKDLTSNKLNDFNSHYDEQRGWHYHATPGKFPYMIGGYMGTVSNRRR